VLNAPIQRPGDATDSKSSDRYAFQGGDQHSPDLILFVIGTLPELYPAYRIHHMTQIVAVHGTGGVTVMRYPVCRVHDFEIGWGGDAYQVYAAVQERYPSKVIGLLVPGSPILGV
jgi:hypothetical protein